MDKPKIIDTHAHLFCSEIVDDVENIVIRAKESNVGAVLMPNLDLKTVDLVLKLCKENENFLFPMLGLHPCYIDENYQEDLNKLEKYFSNEKFIGIGEIGLDLYHDTKFFDLQKDALAIQLSWAKSLRLPISLHYRSAFNEAYELIKSHQNGNLRGVFHCFSGTIEEAKKIIDLGFCLGIGGVLTFKKCELRRTLKSIPLENIVLETDSPYLAPVPFREKNNEPAFLVHVLNELENIYEKDVEELIKLIYNNTKKIFRI